MNILVQSGGCYYYASSNYAIIIPIRIVLRDVENFLSLTGTNNSRGTTKKNRILRAA